METIRIAVIGLGYVGLPLARLFSTKYETIGFDLNKSRVDALMSGHDVTLEVSDELLQTAIANGFKCTSDIEDIRNCNFYVVAVPTPVDKYNNPDLTPLYGASTTVGKVISRGDIVVYESTVYPGVTEDECIPVVEKISGLKYNVDFFAGYSPERINPGDKLHTVDKIKKVCSFKENDKFLRGILHDTDTFNSDIAQLSKKIHKDIIKGYKGFVKNHFSGISQIIQILIGVGITLPITCNALNWIYPRAMELFFPKLSGVKKASKGGENNG